MREKRKDSPRRSVRAEHRRERGACGVQAAGQALQSDGIACARPQGQQGLASFQELNRGWCGRRAGVRGRVTCPGEEGRPEHQRREEFTPRAAGARDAGRSISASVLTPSCTASPEARCVNPPALLIFKSVGLFGILCVFTHFSE